MNLSINLPNYELSSDGKIKVFKNMWNSILRLINANWPDFCDYHYIFYENLKLVKNSKKKAHFMLFINSNQNLYFNIVNKDFMWFPLKSTIIGDSNDTSQIYELQEVSVNKRKYYAIGVDNYMYEVHKNTSDLFTKEFVDSIEKHTYNYSDIHKCNNFNYVLNPILYYTCNNIRYICIGLRCENGLFNEIYGNWSKKDDGYIYL